MRFFKDHDPRKATGEIPDEKYDRMNSRYHAKRHIAHHPPIDQKPVTQYQTNDQVVDVATNALSM
jgi:hypothetical protein